MYYFFQRLFPLQEPGVNSCARTLTKAEIEVNCYEVPSLKTKSFTYSDTKSVLQEFCKSSTATANLLESYKLMLNFYGIRLQNENTGDVERAANWRERFDNLNR